MKKIIIITLGLLVLVSLLNANAIAMLIGSKGNVSLSRASKAIKMQKGELLMNNDVLRTGEESFAAYRYVDAKSTIKMFSNSVSTLSAEQVDKAMNKTLTVSKGSVLTNVVKGGGTFRVNTPSTVASVKGTEFLTKVEEDGSTMFIVNEGEIEVRARATDEVASVAKGKTALIGSAGDIELRDSTTEDLSQTEQEELDAMQSEESHMIRIPVLDKNGNLKYIEISY